MKERWKAIPGWEGIYEVSNLGGVRSMPRLVPNPANVSGMQKVRGGPRKTTINVSGYPVVSLSFKGKITVRYVHELIMLAFRGPPKEGQLIRHLDGDHGNSVLKNLKYGTQSQNMQDAITHGTAPVGSRNGQALLTKKQVRKLRRLHDLSWTLSELAKEFDISTTVAKKCAQRVTYRDVA